MNVEKAAASRGRGRGRGRGGLADGAVWALLDGGHDLAKGGAGTAAGHEEVVQEC